MPTPSPDGNYAITTLYSVPDDAWYLELCLAAEQRALLSAIVPDEDPAREPAICLDPQGRHIDIPYDVMRWFMDQVEAEIGTARAWMRLRPELVEAIHRLRQEYRGCITDDEFPGVLAEVRATVPDSDVASVIEAAFGSTLADLGVGNDSGL
ncbi:hypothetical protein [Streptomyces sp. FH025]|uniref:hypothetical protein n=1 Tax=Streptomyces sp. FH025 TaxID=2815937 RepID=UPI001A9D1221|nr:hypothetical protein [Streptomyces sp. FH025]MBO1414752.1 hypothetical protein [Streptomyces sp. FH025]